MPDAYRNTAVGPRSGQPRRAAWRAVRPGLVVHVGPGLTHGGVSRTMESLVDSDLARTYEFETINTLSARKGLARFSAFPGAVAQLIWFSLFRRPAGLHVHMASRGSFVRKTVMCTIAYSLRVPVIVHIHGGGFLDYVGARRTRQRVARWVLGRSAAVIVLPEAWRQPISAIAPGSTVWVVPNSVEVPDGPTAGIDSDRVVFVGSLLARKGIPELLEASERLSQRWPGFRLVLVGDDADEQVASRMGDRALDTYAEVLGWLDHDALDAVYGMSAIFALPSRVEAMPVSLLEAMSHGLACVVTPVGAVPQIVSDDANGLVVPVGDAAALESAIERLLQDVELRRRLGSNARKTVEERFSRAGTVARMAEIYAACGIGPSPNAVSAEKGV